MSNSSGHSLNRRRWLLTVATATGAQLLGVPGHASTADLPKVDPAEGPAAVLNYVHDASTVDESVRPDASHLCSNCRFYTQPDAAWGPCTLFPGKAVAAKGWCKGWVARS